MTVKRDALDVGELLSIDVGAEVRKLSRAQLESPTQLVVELARRSLSVGASVVDVSCGRRAVTVRDDGEAIAPALLDALAALLDPAAAQAERHRALLALEASGDLALLAIAGLGAAALRVRSGGRVLTQRRGERPAIAESRGSGTTVELGGAPLDPAGVREAIGSAARFAPERLRLGGTPLAAAGFGETVAEETFASPLPGRLALPRTGENARIWILLEGLVAAHLAVPGMPCFEALVEARALFPRGAPLPPASALREAVEPHRDALCARALDLLTRATAAVDRAPASVQARLRELVLTAARRKLRAAAMRSARVFPTVSGPASAGPMTSIDELDALAGSGSGRSIPALFPDQEPGKFLLPGGPVPVLDATERSRLAALLGISFRAPQPRRAEGGALARVRASLRHALRELGRRVRHPFHGMPLPDDALAPAERDFVTTLREHVMTEACEDLDVRLVEGAGPVRRTSRPRPTLLLPRANPVVRAALAALARDPAWIYPVSLALEAIPRPATRSLFLRR